MTPGAIEQYSECLRGRDVKSIQRGNGTQMLFQSFIHLPGVGIKTERLLWENGILNWDIFLAERPNFIPLERYRFYSDFIIKCKEHVYDAVFLAKIFPKQEVWRLYEFFRSSCVFLDIETYFREDKITEVSVAGTFDGDRYIPFIQGINFHKLDLYLSQFKMIVTFSGTSFDIPVLRKEIQNISIPPIHIDLRYLLKTIGIKGGLKKIERDFGIERPPHIKGLSGYDALLLWYRYKKGERKCLKRLVEYNKQDCINLKPLLELSYIRLKEIRLESQS